jgi:hypothetical protein
MRTIFFPMFSLVKRLRVDLRRSLFLALVSLVLLSPLTASAVCNPSRLGPAVSKSTVNEAGGDSVTLQAKITCKPGNWTFNWSIGGTAVYGVDYTAAATSGTASNISGVGLHNIVTVYPIDNSLRDIGRTIVFYISGKGSATSTIIDDDTPRVTVTAADGAASETGPDTGTYRISLDRNTGQAETVKFAMSGDASAGSDYSLQAAAATGVVTQTSDADFSGGDASGNTYVLNGSVELSSDTLVDTSVTQTANSDFNAGDTSGGVYVTGNAVELSSDTLIDNALTQTSSADFSAGDTTNNTEVDSTNNLVQLLTTASGVAIDGGTGADGAYSCASGTCVLAGGTYNFTTIDIAAGATVDVTGASALVFYATGDVNIAGTLNLDGSAGQDGGLLGSTPVAGVAGPGGGDGGGSCLAGTSGDGSGTPGTGGGQAPASGGSANRDGAGGGGYGTAGTAGGDGGDVLPGAGGAAYGDAPITNLYGGSGGGGASTQLNGCIGATGGGGGGAVMISTPGTVTVSGSISANGGNGGNNNDTAGNGAGSGGGGGSGGAVKIEAGTLDLTGAISATGGTGGTGLAAGGNGGDGRVYLSSVFSTGSGTASPAATVNAIPNYASSGSYTSAVLDLGTHVDSLGSLVYGSTVPAGTTLTVDVRVGDTPDLSAVSWQTYATGADISGLGAHQYIQYKGTFSTTDTSLTPTLTDVTVNYVDRYSTPSVPGHELTGAETGLLALWHMNNDATDASGNGYTGALGGNATFTASAMVGSDAVSFDGVDDYVSMGDIAAMDTPGAFTIELWFNRAADQTSVTNHGIYNILVAQSSDAANDNLEIGTQGTQIQFYLQSTALNAVKTVEAGIQNNTWYHLAFVYDQNATNELKLYLDGGLLAQWSDHGGVLASSSTSPFSLGLARPGGSNWGDFQGSMDEVALYTRALSGAEVQADYDLTSGAGGTKEYITSGTFTSSVIDLLTPPDSPATLGYNAIVPAGTGLTVDVRAGDVADTNDASWTAWSTGVASGADLSSLVGTHQYYQYRANFSTTDSALSPSLTDVTVNAIGRFPTASAPAAGVKEYVTSGSFVSSAMDLYASQVLNTLNYTATIPANTTLTVDVRAGDTTDPNDGSWQPWQIDVANGGDISALGTHRYIQYQVNITTADINASATLDDISVNYSAGSLATKSYSLIQTSDADFNAGDSTDNTNVVANSVKLSAVVGSLSELTGSESGLVALWHMNNDWTDAGPNGRNGTAANGAMFTADAMLGGYAGYFDGINDVATFSGFTELGTSNQPYTIEGWVKAAAGESNGNIIHMSSNSSGSGWCLPPVSMVSGKLRAYSWKGSAVSATGVTAVNDGAWHHFATTWDSTGGLRLYVDGALEASTPQATYSASGASNYLKFAVSPGTCSGNNGYFNGQLDEVAVFSRALSDAEVATYADGNITYNTTGSFTSSVIGLGGGVTNLTTLDYTVTTPAGTAITVDIRGGNTPVPDGSWTPWQTGIASGGDISALGSSQYVQYRANLTTTDTTVSPALEDITVNYQGTSGLDEMVIPVGATSMDMILTPIDDTLDEYDEVATLTVVNLTGSTTPGSPASASVTIADNDINEVNVAIAANGAEQGGAPGSFTVSRTGIMDLPLTVNYSVSGTATPDSDYTALSGTVTIPASSGVGTNSALVSFTPINDALIEGDETVTLTISADAAYVIGVANTDTATLVDNDTDGSSRADPSGIMVQTNWADTAPADDVSCTSYGGTWTGTSCIGTHGANQAGWATYDTIGASLDVSTPGQVSSVSTPQQWLQTDDSTSDRGFNVAGSSNSGFATVSGFGDAANVTLAPIDVGDGTDGVFNSATYTGLSIPGITGTSPNITINTSEATHQGVYNFTDFYIAAGDKVTVTGSNPLKLYVQIDTKIDGTLSLNGSGRTPGAGGGYGALGPTVGQGVGPVGVGGGGAPDNTIGTCTSCWGGGGGGNATAGSDGTSSDPVNYPPGLGGEAYGDVAITDLVGGSGGGGNYANKGTCYNPLAKGGGGGGAALLQSGATISVKGLITANGGNGSSFASHGASGSCTGWNVGPAGGGAGGSIKLVSTNIILTSGGTRLSAKGGAGGSSRGGAGGGGWIRLEYTNLQGLAYATAGTGTVSTATLGGSFIAAGSGTYISHVQYMGSVNGSIAAPGVWSTVNWTEELPLGTSMVVWIHSCAVNDCSDRGPSDWSALINGQDISSLTFVDDAHAYIQYKVNLDTSGGVLPRLHDFAVNTISYGFGVWYQTDDSTAETGFNQAGAVNNSTIVAGSGANASVYLLGALGGTGVDGDFDSATYDGSSIPGITGTWPNITIDTDEVSHAGSYNFATFTVRTGHVVRVRGSNPLILKSLGDVTVNGTLNAQGYSGSDSGNNGIAGPAGSAGGASCAAGNGLGAGGSAPTDSSAGAGGAGHASAGLTGETSYTISGGAGGVTYGDSALAVLEGGSGGGGAAAISGGCSRGVYGGGGGGAMQIQTGSSVIVGTVGLISVDGGAGGSVARNSVYSGGGGGGGGSAGSLEVIADQIILNNPGASLSARGGQGGTSYYFGNGGAGGDGRMRLASNSMQGSASINIGSGSLVTDVLTPSTPINASYTSAIHDAGDPITWDTVNWAAVTPTGTTLTVSLHSCALADCSDRGPSDWSLATNAQDISSLPFVNDGDQYIQYRVDMTSDGRLASRLNDIAINEKLDQGGAVQLISTVYDTEDNSNQIALLDWTADTSGPGTSVRFQLRTSADGVNWGAWYGPTSTTDYYTSPGMAINPVHADGVDDRYFQYRAFLVSDNPEFAPILTNVRVGYITFGSGAVVVGFGEAFGDSSVPTSSSSSGGGSLGGGFVLILLLGLAFRSRRSLYFWLNDTRLSTHPVLILVGSVPFLLLVSPTASAAVLNFSNANPLGGATYQFYSVGSAGSNFYQEIYIQNFGSYQGGPGSAAGGAGGPGGNGTDPLSYGGASYSFTGNGSGNPHRVIIYQVNKSPDMIIDFLKDKFDKKPRILQSITSSEFSAEFSIDMRAIGYSDATSDAPIINNQTLVDPFGSATPLTWDMAVDSQAGHTGVNAGKYTYTDGSGPGGSIGTYSYADGGFNMTALPWYLFFDPNDASNVWTRTTNKPPP